MRRAPLELHRNHSPACSCSQRSPRVEAACSDVRGLHAAGEGVIAPRIVHPGESERRTRRRIDAGIGHGAAGSARSHLGDSACLAGPRRIRRPSHVDARRFRSLRAPDRVDGRVPARVRSTRSSRRLPDVGSRGAPRLAGCCAGAGSSPDLCDADAGGAVVRLAVAPAQLHASRPPDGRRPRRDHAARGSRARHHRRSRHRRRRAREARGDRYATAAPAVVRRARGVCPGRRCRHAGPRRRVARGRGRRGRRPARRRRRELGRRRSRAAPMVAPLAGRGRELQRRGDRPARSGGVARHRHAGRPDHVPARDVAHDRRARARDGASPVGRGKHGERHHPAARPRVRRGRRAVTRDALVRSRETHPSPAGLHGHAPPRGARGRPCVHGDLARSVQGGAGDVRSDPARCLGQRGREVAVRAGGRDVRRGALDRNSSAVCSRRRCAGRRSSSSSQAC